MNRTCRTVACLVVLVASLGAVAPRVVRASRYVVDGNGGGDFTTIQAAIDQQHVEWRDEILVMPGTYLDPVMLTSWSPWLLHSSGGPGATTLGPVAFQWGERAPYLIDGFTFAQEVARFGEMSTSRFTHCVFLGGVSGGGGASAGFEDCDFYGRTDLYGLASSSDRPYLLQSSRFHAAPLHINPSNGDIGVRDCLFEGPADALVRVAADDDDPLHMLDCRFENATFGVVLEYASTGGFTMSGCTFRDLTTAGIWYDHTVDRNPSCGGLGDRIAASRFERCGTAVHWIGLGMSMGSGRTTGAYLVLEADTVLASSHDGVVVGPFSGGGLFDCLIDGSLGNGATIRQELSPFGWECSGEVVQVTNSKFTNNRGAGLVIRDSSSAGYVNSLGPSHVVSGCTFAGNDGNGLEISCGEWAVERCIALANGGDGFAWSTSAPARPIRLASNTSALNRGDGFRATGPAHPGDSLRFVQHDLAVMNAGAGIRVPSHPSGSLAFNDAWGNYMGQYVGPASPADSNLTVDPRFCDLSAGLAGLGLQQGSPCGPSGVYGLIGARGEECANVTAVPTSPPAGALAFAVRPSVARGSVEFVVPAGGSEGRVEVYDLAGRVLWRAPLGTAATTVRWNGEGERGRVRAGLYWVRFTRGAESATQRLVWLE